MSWEDGAVIFYGGVAMSEEKVPTLEEWRNLHEIVLKYKSLAPWEWMWDSNIFGVQNPANDEIGYCCVLGKAGVEFGLLVYLGAAGLRTYLRMQSGELDPREDMDAMLTQKCLNVSFESKNYPADDGLEIL